MGKVRQRPRKTLQVEAGGGRVGQIGVTRGRLDWAGRGGSGRQAVDLDLAQLLQQATCK